MSFQFLNRGQAGGDIQEVTLIDTFIDPVSKIRVSNPSNLIDTDFEYGLQPTKWETVELINNTPAFFSRGGDTTIPDITGITTNAGTREITVTTAFAHNLDAGIPIRVSGTKSVTADGSYIINATPTPITFTYLSRANQAETLSIFDLYTSIISGEFFQGSQISISDAEGIVTDGEGPISSLTVKTENKHGFGLNTPFYFLNLNSTISQEFESQNSSSVSFDPTNSATAQEFDGSNTLLQTPVDLSNSATTSLNESPVISSSAANGTITVSFPDEDWSSLKIGDPIYHSVNAASGYFQNNPRGVVFIKSINNIDTVSKTITFEVSRIPDGTRENISNGMGGFFQIADQARTFPGNNVDPESQIDVLLFEDQPFIFDGGNQGYDGDPEDPPNNTSTATSFNNETITVFTAQGILDYYPGAMLRYNTTGNPAIGLQNNTTYFVTSSEPGITAGFFNISIAEFPDSNNIETLPPSGTQTHTFSKIGISLDKNIVHIRDSAFVRGDMLEYTAPENGRFDSDFNQTYYFVKKAYDIHNYELNENPFVPITATGGAVSDSFYDGRIYRSHTFTSVGADSFTIEDLGTDPEIEFLVVAGGGSGGDGSTTNANGGGGGGGILYAKKYEVEEEGVIPVIVGNGGPPPAWRSDRHGNNGQDSVFGNFVAIGGGGGANGRAAGSTRDGRPGGSGGGSGWGNTWNNIYFLNTGVSTQRSTEGVSAFGNDGAFTSITWTGGGGGGANPIAQLSSLHGGRGAIGNNSVAAAWGGFGASFDIQGRPIFYAGGGGGAGNTSERSGEGMHGGGRGFGTTSSYNHTEYDLSDPPVTINGSQGGSQSLHARANTGGGGGATSYWSNNTSWGGRTAGRGGSGIVVVRYPITREPEFQPMQATGGNVVETVVDPDGVWRVHKFTTPGQHNFSVTNPGTHGVQFLVVAGGGAGGNGVTTNANGGGGGGGVVHSTSYRINSSGTIPITVGAGGPGSNFRTDINGANGENSSFGSFVAIGGGGGGGRGSGGARNSKNGGSSGGYGYYNNDNTSATPQQQFVFTTADGSASGFGNRGGRRGQTWTGAGGGGAGSQGHDGNYQSEPLRSADGGYGYLCTIEGQMKFYAGGGGGGGNSSERAGSGWHGGGRGFARTTYYDFNEYPAEGTINPITLGSATLNAVNNTGGGGGATSYWSSNTSWGSRGAGSGGHGIVIIRYRLISPIFFGRENATVATGGEEKEIVVQKGNSVQLYKTHTFRHVETENFVVESVGSLGAGQVEYLIVAGGGGGGSDMGGGGGAGGVLEGEIAIGETTYPVVVGRGGDGEGRYNNNPPPGQNGDNSSFAGMVALGGGGGSSGHYYNQNESSYTRGGDARSGGSGGGGSAANRSSAGGRPGGAGTPGQGTSGGFGRYFPNGQYAAGGGGGAGGNPAVDAVQGIRSGDGGPGIISDIMGYPFYFGGGGGGAAHNEANRAGHGGLGGGAPGSRWQQEGEQSRFRGREGYGGINASTVANYQFDYHRPGAQAGPNTGGGGGGGMHQGRGGGGGSGIVVIRYPISIEEEIPL